MESLKNPNNESVSPMSIEEETLEAIADGKAIPLPEFLSESPEARMALLRAFEEANNIQAGLSELEPEQRERFVKTLSEALGSEETPNGTAIMQGLLALGVQQISSNAVQNATSPSEEFIYLTASVAASAVAIYKFWKVYSNSNKLPTDSELIRERLKEVIAT